MPEETEISNIELEKRLTKMFEEHAALFNQHTLDDLNNFGKINEKMENLATKDDIREMKKLFKAYSKILSSLGRYRKITYTTILKLAGFLVAIAAIGQSLKLIFNWFRPV